MAGPVVAFPDAERLIVDYLTDRPEMTGITVDDIPPAGFDGTQRVVLVSRVGGAWIDDEHLDRPLVELEVYGPDKPTAHTDSLSMRTALVQLRGVTYGSVTVTDVVEADAVRWLPDYNRPAANRYLTTIQLSLTPVE
ncbi:hypothetical protein ACX6XY_07240 [Streptomyces sp. O3]